MAAELRTSTVPANDLYDSGAADRPRIIVLGPEKTAAVVILNGDDWVGIYVKGELKAEGHSLQEDEVVTALGIPVEVIWRVDEEFWDECGGRCPSDLEELRSIIAIMGDGAE